MKKIFFFLLLVASTAIISMAQNKADQPIKIGVGTTLTYTVDFNFNQYDFVCTFIDDEDDMIVDYKMTDANSTSGRVYMSKYALDKSTAMYNYFGGGEKRLDFQTTILVSKVIYDALKNNTPIHIDSGDGDETMTFGDFTKLPCTIDGVESSIPVLYGQSDNSNQYWVFDDASFPVILKMDLGWSITIKSIVH